MGTLIASLQKVQSIEHQLSDLRRRLKTRKNAVRAQQARIEQMQADLAALEEKRTTRRKDADGLDLELKSREEDVTKLRGALNTAKTNKEYAAILTQINTIKADNAKVEEEALKVMQDVDAIKADCEKIKLQLGEEEKRLAAVEEQSNAEIERLEAMVADLDAQRAEAAKDVPPEVLTVFDRLAETYDGDAMAVIEVHGRKPPFDYICGGCFMSLNAEHANVLQTRDEVRQCDNCKRILYVDPKAQDADK